MSDKEAARLGRKGGKNSRKNLPAGEATELGQRAVKARWDAYYKANPDKLKAKLEREKKKKAGKKAGK